MDVKLPSTYDLPLQVSHRILSVSNVEVGDHYEPAVFALGVHGPYGSMHLKEGCQLVVLHV